MDVVFMLSEILGKARNKDIIHICVRTHKGNRMIITSEKVVSQLSRDSKDPAVIAVKLNGGSVVVAFNVNGSWVTAKTYTADTVETVYFAGSEMRITPTGGAVVFLGD